MLKTETLESVPSTPSTEQESTALTLTERTERGALTESERTERTEHAAAFARLTDEHVSRARSRITESRAVSVLARLYSTERDSLGAAVLSVLALSAPSTDRFASLLTLTQCEPSAEALSHALATVRGVARQYLARTFGNAPSAEPMSESTEHDAPSESAERAPITESRAWMSDRLALGAAVLRAMHGHAMPKRTRSARSQCSQCAAIGSAVLAMMSESHRWEWSESESAPSESAERVHSLAVLGAYAADGESVRPDHDPARRALTLSKTAVNTLGAALDRSAVIGSALESEPSAREALTEHVHAVALATKRERAPRERTTPISVELLSESTLETLLSRALRVHSDRTNTDEHAERFARKAFGRIFVRTDALAVLTFTPRTLRITEHACAAFGTLGAAALHALDATTEQERASESVLTERTIERSVIRKTELLRALGIEPTKPNRDALGSVLLSLAHYSLARAEVVTRESVASTVERDALSTLGTIAERARESVRASAEHAERVRAAIHAERVSALTGERRASTPSAFDALAVIGRTPSTPSTFDESALVSTEHAHALARLGSLALSTFATPRAVYVPSRAIRYVPSTERFATPSTPKRASAQWWITPNGSTFGRLSSV